MAEFYSNVFQKGAHVYVRGFDSGGNRIQRKVKAEPRLFIPTKNPTGYKDIFGNDVKPKEFSTPYEAKQFIERYKGVQGTQIYGYDRWAHLHVYDYFRDTHPDHSLIKILGIDIEVDSSSGFPKPEEATKEVRTISMRCGKACFVFGLKEYQSDNSNIYYIQASDEHDLLLRFLKQWENIDPDVITGWNTDFFDIPYLVNRIRQVVGEKAANRLSPWGSVTEKYIRLGQKEQLSYVIGGISQLDYQAVYKKFRLKPRDSYRLDRIAELEEIDIRKTDISEYRDLDDLYQRNFQLYVDYNVRDVDVVFALDEQLGYLDQVFTLAYYAGVNYNDTLTTITMWDVKIHNYLMEQHIVVPSVKMESEKEYVEGGYVKEVPPSQHKWVMSFDLNSLYPHLIMQYNISPETRIRQIPEELDEIRYQMRYGGDPVDKLLSGQIDLSLLKKYNVGMTANGNFYKNNDRGFLPALMNELYTKRKEFKRQMIEAKIQAEEKSTPEIQKQISRCDNMQGALKILLNSAYGALANEGYRWNESTNANAVTKSGQLSIRWIEKRINEYLNNTLKTENVDYVFAIDTDSVYINFEEIVNKTFNPIPDDVHIVIDFLDKVAKQIIEPIISKSYHRLADYMNACEQKMVMKRENIGDKAIWTSKKHYVMNVYDSEGVRYQEPDLKIMGIEAIRSSTPIAAREAITEAIRLIMDTDEQTVQDFVTRTRDKFEQLPYDQIAFPRGVNFTSKSKRSDGSIEFGTYKDAASIYKKGTPIAVKGALLYNNYIIKRGLDNKLEIINDGEKVKYCYLLQPNPIHDTVIATPDGLPEELELERYLDRDTQFEKGFLNPLISILNAVGWKPEKINTIENFFG